MEEKTNDPYREFLNKLLTENELPDFRKWINNSSDNRKLSINALKLKKTEAQLYFLKHIDKEGAWQSIIEKIHTRQRSLRHKWYYATVAVAIVIVLILFGYIQGDSRPLHKQFPYTETVQTALTLNNETKVNLKEKDSSKKHDIIRLSVKQGVLIGNESYY